MTNESLKETSKKLKVYYKTYYKTHDGYMKGKKQSKDHIKKRIESRKVELRQRAQEAQNIERNAQSNRIQRIGIIEYINALKEDPDIPEDVKAKMDHQRVQLRREIEYAVADEQMGHDNAVGCHAAIENMRYIQRNWNQSANELAIIEEDRSKNETEE